MTIERTENFENFLEQSKPIKEQIKKDFIKTLNQFLRDEAFLPDALNASKFIRKGNKEYESFQSIEEVNKALDEINAKTGEFTITSADRLGNLLVHYVKYMESTDDLKRSLTTAEILKYEAIISYAHVHVLKRIEALYVANATGKDAERYFNAKSEFENELYVMAKPEFTSYYECKSALNELKQALEDPQLNSIELKKAGINVLDTTQMAFEKGEVPNEDLPRLINFIQGTTEVLKNPDDITKIKKHHDNTKDAIGMNRKWGKLIGLAMLAFLGVAIIGVSIVLAVGTFGGTTPLSAAGLALGTNIIASSFAVGIGMAGGLGLASTGGLFAHRAWKGDIAIAGEQVEKEAEKESKLRS